MVTNKQFKLFERQDKGVQIREALQNAGYTEARNWRRSAFILSDHDQRGELLQMQREHKKFFVYPHSARSMILWDGIIPSSTMVSCNFVFAPGQKEVMKLYGYRRPVEVMGWTYCPIIPFKPIREVTSILFAPIHPNAGVDYKGRRLMDFDVELNRRTFRRLLSLGIPLTVRYGGDLSHNGLTIEPGVTYEVSDLTLKGALQAIQSHTFIVGHQTIAYLSIASGKPTAMFGEDIPPHSMHIQARSWDMYSSLLKFPLDILKGDAKEVMNVASNSDGIIREWKYNFIGEAFQPSRFISILETYLL